ncbi:MAG: radical SAM protein [Planctomycetota bacterium]|jgi:MiaB/RimO family radical SAM methylthiotransferase
MGNLKEKDVSRSRTVCIAYANGCPRSRMFAAKLFPYFEVNGWNITQKMRRADLVLVSTCGVNQRAEKKSIRLLSIVDRKRKRDSQFVVVGCLPGINEKAILEKFNAIAIGPTASANLDDVINAKVKLGKVKELNLIQPIIARSQKCFNIFDRLISEFEPSRVFVYRIRDRLKPKTSDHIKEGAFSIRILAGCPGECAYCAIRFAEGSLVSRPMEAVLADLDAGLEGGNRNFRLIGTDVGAYGQDINTSIVELLRNLLARRGEFVLHLPEFHPRWLIQYRSELIDMLAAAQDRFGSIIVPIESGSEKILKLMRREHTAAEAKECLLTLRRAAPNIRIFTHVLVGFPGESEKDFDDTVEFLREAPCDEIAVYKYEARPNIEAEQLPDKVSETVKHMRVCKLLKEFRGTANVAL